VIIYAHTITPRLHYIVDFIGKETGGTDFFQLTDDAGIYKASGDFKINYSDVHICEDEFFLHPHLLLSETDIKPQQINCFGMNDYKAFFKTAGDFPFDIFAASFYLLSRYEEYLPHEKDMYGRYAHENSLAFREGFLHLPLINIWLQDFRKAIQKKIPHSRLPTCLPAGKAPDSPLSFLPTYDIDQAYSYKDKSFFKNAGGFIRAIVKANWQQANERLNVLSGKARDPFDAYQWMDQLHERYNLEPFYFFILADKPGKYDKNISPTERSMQELILHHYDKYQTGIHPSWQSGDDISQLTKEIQTLKQITNHPVINSRQHYIRFTLPQTFRYLINAGIKHDFSMGYGSINGFRASVASSFYWFDLEKNEASKLLLHPFCYMDANSFFEQKYSPQQAYSEMKQYYEAVKSVNGIMISIWHNTFLGTDKLYAGWKEVYEKFIAEISG